MLVTADRSNLPFLASALTFDALLAAVPLVLLLLVVATLALGLVPTASGVDLAQFMHRFLPAHPTSGTGDPFAVAERLLARITENRAAISLYAVPLFIWFGTRLFAATRTALTIVYDLRSHPGPERHVLVGFLLAKLRDVAMVILVLALFLANSALTTLLALAQARDWGIPLDMLGRFLGELLAVGFGVLLFFLLYRHATERRPPAMPAFRGAFLAALLFELAKRLFGWYLANFARLDAWIGDANLGALVLFVLWVWYTSLVFLLGGAVVQALWHGDRPRAMTMPA